MKKNNILLISGGTGGHVIPSVNFGNFLVNNDHQCVLFLDERGTKYKSDFKGKIIKIKSYHLGYNFFHKLRFIFSYPITFLQSLFYLIIIRPRFVIAFGSYASFTPLLILSFFKFLGLTKIYLHEQNSVMGSVNRIFSRFADKIFLNFQNTNLINDKYLNKTLHVGFPNNNLSNFNRDINLDKNKIKKIIVTGGSQGAKKLNLAICKIIAKMKTEITDKIKISIQSPFDEQNKLKKILDEKNIVYEIKNFYNDMPKKLLSADILIARSGAGTVQDVINSKIPSILVPLSFSSNEHQLMNAKYLSKKNAAILIEEKDLEKKEIHQIIENFINDNIKQNVLINNLKKIENYDCNRMIYKEIGFN